MSDRKHDTHPAERALPHHKSSYRSTPEVDHSPPQRPMAPSAPPTQSSYQTWAGNPSSTGAYQQLPTSNSNVAQSASSPSQVRGPRRPRTNQPFYPNPDTIKYWKCCRCEYDNHPANCPVLCAICPHRKCGGCVENVNGASGLGFEGIGSGLNESLPR